MELLVCEVYQVIVSLWETRFIKAGFHLGGGGGGGGGGGAGEASLPPQLNFPHKQTQLTPPPPPPPPPQILHYYPACACAARGYVIGRGVYIFIYKSTLFWNQSFISQNTHFQRSILTQIGFSSNLMASGTA